MRSGIEQKEEARDGDAQMEAVTTTWLVMAMVPLLAMVP